MSSETIIKVIPIDITPLVDVNQEHLLMAVHHAIMHKDDSVIFDTMDQISDDWVSDGDVGFWQSEYTKLTEAVQSIYTKSQYMFVDNNTYIDPGYDIVGVEGFGKDTIVHLEKSIE